MTGAEWVSQERRRIKALPVDTTDVNVPDDYIVMAAFPKRRYYIVETDDEYLVYAEDDHGSFS